VISRLFLTRCAVITGAYSALVLASAEAGNGGLSSAQLQRLHRLHLPVIAPSAVPPGFRVTKAEPLPGGHAYRIVYANSAGASITFEVGQLSGGQVAAATPAPKRGFLQRLLGGAKKAVAGPSTAPGQSSGTAGEAEGQGTSAIVADSKVIGPVRFTPTGQCLQGTADSSKAQVHGVQVRVSGCNFDDPDTLIGAYKSAHRY
jgi:hypothetical protein